LKKVPFVSLFLLALLLITLGTLIPQQQ